MRAGPLKWTGRPVHFIFCLYFLYSCKFITPFLPLSCYRSIVSIDNWILPFISMQKWTGRPVNFIFCLCFLYFCKYITVFLHLSCYRSIVSIDNWILPFISMDTCQLAKLSTADGDAVCMQICMHMHICIRKCIRVTGRVGPKPAGVGRVLGGPGTGRVRVSEF